MIGPQLWFRFHTKLQVSYIVRHVCKNLGDCPLATSCLCVWLSVHLFSHPSVRMKQLSSHWVDFVTRDLCLEILVNCQQNSVLVKAQQP